MTVWFRISARHAKTFQARLDFPRANEDPRKLDLMAHVR